MTPRKEVCYRLNEDPCKKGWLQQDCDPALEGVYTAITGGALIAGAVITPCGDCPREIHGSVTLNNNDAVPLLPTIVATCTGTTTVQAADHAPIRVVQPEGTAFLVKLCKSADAELVLLCAPNGDRISLQYDVTTIPPTLQSAWNLTTNAAYAGDTTTLSDCGKEKLDVGAPIPFCAAGVNYTRTDIFDAQSGAVLSSLWQDASGAQVAAPVGAVMGECRTDTERVFIPVRTVCITNGVVSTTYFQRESINWNETNASTVGTAVVEYSLNGATWSSVVPTGVISIGECNTCQPATAKGLTTGGV